MPFQCSTSVWLTPPLANSPTAQTLLLEIAATPKKRLNVPGFGFVMTLQVEPFQCSMSAWPPLSYPPTAHTSLAAMAVTARSSLGVVRDGLEAMLQFVPFQCSITCQAVMPRLP